MAAAHPGNGATLAACPWDAPTPPLNNINKPDRSNDTFVWQTSAGIIIDLQIRLGLMVVVISLWPMRKWRSRSLWGQVVLVESILMLSIAVAGSYGRCRSGMSCGSETFPSAATGNQRTSVSSRCVDSSGASRYTSVFGCGLTKRWLRALPPELLVITATFNLEFKINELFRNLIFWVFFYYFAGVVDEMLQPECLTIDNLLHCNCFQ